MHKGRLEAFSDGVMAVIITIMVLEIKAPHGTDLSSLVPLVPVLLCYGLSFLFLSIYWTNHHHLLQAAQRVNGAILWANLHLLFWLSLVPFMTSWMGEHGCSPWPVALYGVDLLICGVAYYILAQALISHHGKDSAIAHAIGRDKKGKLSILIYAIAIPFAFYNIWVSYFLYAGVAVLWLVPDRRIERILANEKSK